MSEFFASHEAGSHKTISLARILSRRGGRCHRSLGRRRGRSASTSVWPAGQLFLADHRGAASGFLYKDALGNPVPTGVKDDFADSKIETFDPTVLEGIRTGRNTQYQELLLRRGTIQNHTLGIQGGYKKLGFYVEFERNNPEEDSTFYFLRKDLY